MENKKQELEIAGIFRKYGDEHSDIHKLHPVQIKAFNDIIKCRRSALGGHIEKCDHCGYTKHAQAFLPEPGAGLYTFIQGLCRGIKDLCSKSEIPWCTDRGGGSAAYMGTNTKLPSAHSYDRPGRRFIRG